MKTKKITIKQKGSLKHLLYHEGYDKIAIWADGTWVNVGSGYGGEQSGDNPEVYILRSSNYDLTRKEVNNLIVEKEIELNR